MKRSENTNEPVADRECVITRVFDAPARLLFEAYSKPEHIKRWFGPKGWPVTLCEMDFREGGYFRFAMTGPDGRQGTPFGGQYLEIVPNRKLVYDVRFESEPAFGLKTHGEKMIVTVTYDENDGKTTVTIRTVFNTIAMKHEHLGHGYEEGVGSGCDQLADLVSEMLARRR
jgi:uncharacterized protein YndB with AHSA1/START domain